MRSILKIKFCKKCLKEIPSLEEKLSINPINDFKRMVLNNNNYMCKEN
jgi:hypothetical protein